MRARLSDYVEALKDGKVVATVINEGKERQPNEDSIRLTDTIQHILVGKFVIEFPTFRIEIDK